MKRFVTYLVLPCMSLLVGLPVWANHPPPRWVSPGTDPLPVCHYYQPLNPDDAPVSSAVQTRRFRCSP